MRFRVRILHYLLALIVCGVCCVIAAFVEGKPGVKVDYKLGLEDADRTNSILLGNLRAVVVLMEFPDKPVDKKKYPKEKLEAFMFDKTAKGLGHYMAENSGGKYTIEGEVYGWYMSKCTTGELNDTPGGLQYAMQRLTEEAVRNVIKEGLNPAEFDNDGPDGIPRSEGSTDDDGLIDELYIVPSGGANCGIGMFGRYADFAKRTTFIYLETSHGGFGNIGFYVHEMGHHFYFAWDHYGNHYQGEYGSGCWAMMGLGCWSQNGQVQCDTVWCQPAHFTAFSKRTMYWVKPRAITESTENVKLTAMEIKPDAVEVPIPGTLEYFLIENRQPIGFEDKLPGGGLLIYRCHSTWKGYFWLLQADGRADLQNGEPIGRPYPYTRANLADDGDPFPGSENNRIFGPETNPASRSAKGMDSGITIRNISDPANEMTFDIVINKDIQDGLRNIVTIKGSLEELKHGNVVRRRNAAISLEEIADERAIEGLAQALRDGDVEVKLHVMGALERIAVESGKDMRHRDQNTRIDGIAVFEKFRDARVPEILQNLAKNGKDDIATVAITALGSMGPNLRYKDAVQMLKVVEQSMESGPGPIKAAAVNALSNFAVPGGDFEKSLLEALTSNDLQILKKGAEGAGKLKLQKAVGRLCEIANDESIEEGARIAALKALAEIGESNSAGAIEDLLKTSSFPLRLAAARALQRTVSRENLPALLAAMQNKEINKGSARHGDIRHSIKGAINRAGVKAVPEIVKFLQDETVHLEAKAFFASSLADIGDPSGVAPMLKLSLEIDSRRDEWDQSEVVDHAVRNLHIKLRKELPMHARRILDRKPTVENKADYETAKTSLDEFISECAEWLKDRDAKRRMDGIELLKSSARKPVPDALLRALKDKHPDVRKAAADAIAALKDERAVPSLMKMLDDEYFPVRNKAAWALGQIRDAKAVPALVKQLAKEKDRRVHTTIVRSLGDIGTPETEKPLREALKSPVYEARITAARYLGKYKGEIVVNALIGALRDPDHGILINPRWANVSSPRLRVWAMRSLAQIGDQKAVGPIREYLTSDDLSCRYPAALALMRLGGIQTDGVSWERLPRLAARFIEKMTGKEFFEFVPREYLRR